MTQDSPDPGINNFYIDTAKFKGCILDYWIIKNQNNEVVFYDICKTGVEDKLKELQNGK